MRLFLCSNFRFLAKKFLPRFLDMKKTNNCLLVGYADEKKDFYSESNTFLLQDLGFNVFHLDKDYDFKDKLDMIFVKGGNVTQLLHYLRKYKQFEKIKDLVLTENVLFVGQSAGAIVAGNETEWTLSSEPYEYDLKTEFGKNALDGFGFINKIIFVHASRFRFPVTDEIEAAGTSEFKVTNEFFYKAYLKERKENRNKNFIVLKDNEAFLKDDNKEKIVKINWSKYPVLDEFRVF